MAHNTVPNEVVGRAKCGDKYAVAACFDACQQIARHYARKAVLSGAARSARMDADDLTGYAQVAIAKSIATYDPSHGASFTTYAVQKIWSEVSDALRRHGPLKRRQHDKGGKVPASISEIPNLLRDKARGPVAEAAGSDLIDRLLGSVREDFRETARLWAVEGMNLPELADRFGLTRQAISHRIGIACRSMREEAAKMGLAEGPVWGEATYRRKRGPTWRRMGRPSKPVRSDMGDYFDSAAEASDHYGLSSAAVTKSIHGGWRSAGRRWFFAEVKEVA